ETEEAKAEETNGVEKEADEEAAKTNGHSEETNGVANGDSEKRAAEESEATEATSPTKKAKVQEETTEAA
ncbi:hypothetical protein QHH03_32435, partial [Aphanizomenon sp. 202]|nr:hypothetical protein [Aphanizomenon sp. 202]